MTNDNANPARSPDDNDRKDYLDRVRLAAGAKTLAALTVKYGRRSSQGKRTRVQLCLTPVEHLSLTGLTSCASAIIGRPVKPCLMMRLALTRLLPEVTKALADPVEAERFKAQIMKVREDRLGEPS